jgi:putative transcription factor
MSDWDEVTYVVRKKPLSGSSASGRKAHEAGINAAQRQGLPIETHKKATAAKNVSNRPVSNPSQLRKLDSDDVAPPTRISKEFSKKLVELRVKKGWNRQQLAFQVNLTDRVIEEYENGKAIPQQNVIQKLCRLLGDELPRK